MTSIPKARGKKQIVILNLYNLTGVLNHSAMVGDKYKPIRICYRELLKFVTNEHTPMKAVAISQQDPKKNLDLAKHQKFLRGLAPFGWSYSETLYDTSSGDISSIRTAILDAIYHGNTVEDHGEIILAPGFDPSNIELIFINGSQLWAPIIEELHHDGGFTCKIAFTHSARHECFSVYDFIPMEEFVKSQFEIQLTREKDGSRPVTPFRPAAK